MNCKTSGKQLSILPPKLVIYLLECGDNQYRYLQVKEKYIKTSPYSVI
jgi:hypothetical protein